MRHTIESMRTLRKKVLEAAGWKVGSAAEFLGLDAAEQAMVELRLGLGKSLREKRTQSGLTQTQLARRIGSSQSRSPQDGGVGYLRLAQPHDPGAAGVAGEAERDHSRDPSGGALA